MRRFDDGVEVQPIAEPVTVDQQGEHGGKVLLVEIRPRDYDRAMKLLADSVVTAAQAEDARTGLDVAEAQLRAAEFNQRYAVVRATADGVVLRRQLEVGQLVGPGAPVLVLRTERKGLVLRALPGI